MLSLREKREKEIERSEFEVRAGRRVPAFPRERVWKIRVKKKLTVRTSDAETSFSW